MSDAALLTHRHVEVFRAVMTAGSVTGAAEALSTSQPTISRELSRMESLLRLGLFHRRRGRGVVPVAADDQPRVVSNGVAAAAGAVRPRARPAATHRAGLCAVRGG